MERIINLILAVKVIRDVVSTYGRCKVQTRHAFVCSASYRAVSWIWSKLKVALKYSVLGRITEIRDGPLTDILGGSDAFVWLASKASNPFSKLYSAFGDSFFAKNICPSFRRIASSPFRAAGFFLLISGSVNTLLSIVFGPDMGLVGALLRAAWIGFGILGIVSPDGYRPIAGDILLLRFIKNKKVH